MREWLGQPNLRPEEDLFLAFQGDEAVGYVQNAFEPPLKRVVMEWGVHPDHVNRGVGASLLERSLALAGGKDYRVAHIPLPYGALAGRHLAKSMGFKVVRRQWEMRLKDVWQVPEPRIPPGFTLRSWIDGDERNLTDIQNLAFSRHWGFSPNTTEETEYKVRMSFYRPQGILFITEVDKVVGYCWTRIEEGPRGITGFISMMGTHPQYRGRGLGEAVMRAGVSYLRGAGVARADLSVDGGNPSAIKIYKSWRLQKKGSHPVVRKEDSARRLI